MNAYLTLSQIQRLRISDGAIAPIFEGCQSGNPLLVMIWPQLGDFDSFEYAWWIQRELDKIQAKNITLRAIGIGDRAAGQKFCDYTGFSREWLFVDPQAEIHASLGLYRGLSYRLPFLSKGQNTWLCLLLMCAGIGSPGTLAEVFRGYFGDRQAPQLIGNEDIVRTKLLPPIEGSLFQLAGGSGFQRPFELATLRLRNMVEVLGNYSTYVPQSAYLTQRGGTFFFDSERNLVYEHRDRGLLGFAANMSYPLSFLD